MKVLFTASQRGKAQYGEIYKLIYDTISQLGHTHVDNDVVSRETEDFYKELSKGGRDANVKLYKRKIKYIQEADLCIFECSAHSLSIGFVIQKSLELNKPTIVLYLNEETPYFLTGNEDEKLIARSYTKENIKKVLQEAFEDASSVRDKRFNFFISPRLLQYLEKASKEAGITKSTFIRNLLLENKRKFQKSTE